MIRYLLLPGIVSSLLLADAMQWRAWDEALFEAAESKKIIMVEAVREGCHYCDDMQRAVFDDPVMAAYIQQRFIPVKINLAREPMPLGIKVPMTPSFYFISAERKLLKSVPGSWNQEDFRSLLDGITP